MNVGDLSPNRSEPGTLEKLRRQLTAMLEESDRRGAQRLLREVLAVGHSRVQLLREVVNPAVEAVSASWAGHHELSLSQIYVTGLIVKDAVEILSPETETAEKPIGRVVIGVAEGDHHGLGKRIVGAFLRSAGFVVVDLGLSVPPKAFVDAALAENADIIAVSALMVDPALRIREVREEMKRRGVESIQLLVGGAPFRYNSQLYKMAGADATAPTAYEAIDIARRLLEGRHARQ
ncbi:MAG: cobalamin B12-binding domain-containing protein [Chloroflexi bacterium]|nr:cobalamin B12-binding domain-containing protein [Chloroflexota bacterium]